MASKWTNVVDAAGVERRVRHIDAREIEAIASGVKQVEVKPAPEPVEEVEDRSIAPKVSRKGK